MMSNEWMPNRGGGMTRHLGAGRSVNVGPKDIMGALRLYRWYVTEHDGMRGLEGQGHWPTAGQACADAERVLAGAGLIPARPRSVCPHCGQEMPVT